MKISLSKKSWHYRVNVFVKNSYLFYNPENFCAHFWSTILCVLALPFVYFYRKTGKFKDNLIFKIRDAELKKSSLKDIVSSAAADRRGDGENSPLWNTYLKNKKLSSYLSVREIDELRPYVYEVMNSNYRYTGGILYRLVERMLEATYFFFNVVYTLFVLRILVFICTFDLQLATANLFKSLLVFTAMFVAGCAVIALNSIIVSAINVHRKISYSNAFDKIPEVDYNKPIQFIKKGFTAFKEKTCHKIEWSN